MDGSTKAALAMYFTFYILLSLLFTLWLCSILSRWFRIYPFSFSSRTIRPTTIVVFTTNQELPHGLEPSVIESFPKFVCLRGPEDTKNDTHMNKVSGECVVCLGSFEDNETLRLLPKCGHVFHADCVDTWLRSNATCPSCRANLLPNGDPPSGSSPVEVVVHGGRDGG